MRRLRYTCFAFAALTCVIANVTAQSQNSEHSTEAARTRMVRLGVGQYLKSLFAVSPQFRDRKILLDSARISDAVETKLHAEPKNPTARDAAQLDELALAMGGKIATRDELPHCPVRYKKCGPLDKMAVQIGEPTFSGDSAFVSYRVCRAFGDAFPYARSDEYLLALQPRGNGWRVTTTWVVNHGNLSPPLRVTIGGDQ